MFALLKRHYVVLHRYNYDLAFSYGCPVTVASSANNEQKRRDTQEDDVTTGGETQMT